MSYLSPEFAVFFLAFLVLYWSLGKWGQVQKILLLAASYGLYASLDWLFAAILGVYSACLLLFLAAAKQWPDRRRVIIGTAVFLSVFNLAFFKYFDFATKKITVMGDMEKSPYEGAPGLSVSPDGKYLLYVQLDEARNNLMMAENFR